MFGWIKAALGGKKQSFAEQTTIYNLTDKPFARALLLRASQYQDETEHELKKMLGRIRPIARPEAVNEFAASCAITVAYYVTVQAMESIGRHANFRPHEAVPKDAPMVVAFSLFVLAGIYYKLKAEGFELDFRELSAQTGKLFFMFHSVEEKVENFEAGTQAFRTVAEADAENVKEWHDSLMELVNIYILQWTTENEEARQLDCIPLFGTLLSELLSTVED